MVAKCKLFLVKSKVHALMSDIEYTVYVHLDQISGKVKEAKWNCKADQGGCCKHGFAFLHILSPPRSILPW